MEESFSQYAGFIGVDKDRHAMTFGTTPRRLSIVGGLVGDGSIPAPDADISVAIREGTSKEDAIELLGQVIAELHGTPTEGLDLMYLVTTAITRGLQAIEQRSQSADNVVPLRPQ
jgi:hypothetical protein